MALYRLRPLRSGWPGSCWVSYGRSVAVQAGRLAVAPSRRWGMGARVLVYFPGLGVLGWDVGLGTGS